MAKRWAVVYLSWVRINWDAYWCLRETHTHVQIRITYNVTYLLYMWPDLPKGVLYTHSFKSHFSPPFDRHNTKLTVDMAVMAKSTAVCFHWGFFLQPVWRTRVLGCSINGPILPGQADRRQGITTRLAGEIGRDFSYILWYLRLKTAWIDTTWP